MPGWGNCPSRGRPMCTALLLVALFLLCTLPGPSESILCGPCNPLFCEEHVDCPKGITTDPCGCCEVCSKLVNETCGGKHGLLGRCAPGLECFISPEIGQPITGHEEGVCEVVGLNNCANVNCEEPVVSQCPADSILIRNMSQQVAHGCCKPPLACECDRRACVKRACPAGYKSALVEAGLGKPGRCCDKFRCERSEKCRSVSCPEEMELPCETDSYRPPKVASPDGCCSISPGCKCQIDSCPEVKCPAPLQIQVVSKATGKPGSCCDQFRCVNDSAQSCEYMHVGHEYKHGEQWRLDKCTTCVCRNGLTFCQAETCNTPLCAYNLVPDGECCPVCRGCVSESGLLYNNSEVWREGDCVTCRCEAGEALCQAELCAQRCHKPRYVHGQCCPICDGEATVVMQPPHCADLSNCSAICPGGLQRNSSGCYICKCKPEDCDLECKYGYVVEDSGQQVCECTKPPHHCSPIHTCKKRCVYGFRKSRSGCPRCRCNKCPPLNCTKRCVHYYQTNDQGCTICKCKEAPTMWTGNASHVTSVPEITSSATTEPEEVRTCLSSSGRRHDDGESWHDGCRRCYCHNGKEMCSLITCQSPRCANPVFRVGDCCPTCPDVSLPTSASSGVQERCVAVSGNHYAEGETWQLDECTLCICHDGGVLCETQTCPPLLCRFPVKHKDRCCAVCPGGENIPTLHTAGLGACTSAVGTVYKHGDVWQPTPCQGCICKNGQTHCFSQTCPSTPCDKPVLMKGQCCPSCLQGKVTAVCTHHGVQFGDREEWQEDNCTHCQCLAGKVVCQRTHCPVLQCTVLVKMPTNCCPVCLNDTNFTFPVRNEIPRITTDQHEPDGTGTDEDPVEKPVEKKNYLVATAVLAPMAVILLFLILVLIYVVMRQRRTGTFTTNMDHNMLKDIKIRPKSTNLDLQGAMPAGRLYDTSIQAKPFNCGKIPSEMTPLTNSKDVVLVSNKPIEEQEKALLPVDEDDVPWSKLSIPDIPSKHLYDTLTCDKV